jgi:hypothetical protein
MNPWRSISGAICFNVFLEFVKQPPKKIDDLVFPICSCIYLSNHWDAINFSKTDELKDLLPYVSGDVLAMKDILIKHPDKLLKQIDSYADHLNGSIAFSVVLIQSMYNGNQSIYRDDLRALFQDCWETIFWFMQEIQDAEVKNTITDFTSQHEIMFQHLLDNINSMNPIKK